MRKNPLKHTKLFAAFVSVFILVSSTNGNHVVNKDIRNIKIEKDNQMRIDAQNRVANIRASTTLRIQENKDRKDDMRASTTLRIQEMKDRKNEFRALTVKRVQEIRASTTIKFQALRDEKGEKRKQIQLKTFEARKNALISELNATYKNLINIRARIAERITIIEEKNLSTIEAKANLSIADEKLAKARIAIDTFINLPAPTIPATNESGETEVNLEKPRKIGDEAIKSLKDSRDVLKKTLESIIKIKPLVASSTEPIN